jgi:hypothetical protein
MPLVTEGLVTLSNILEGVYIAGLHAPVTGGYPTIKH